MKVLASEFRCFEQCENILVPVTEMALSDIELQSLRTSADRTYRAEHIASSRKFSVPSLKGSLVAPNMGSPSMARETFVG